jgi:hypothetical protein
VIYLHRILNIRVRTGTPGKRNTREGGTIVDKFDFYWRFLERPKRRMNSFINRKILRRNRYNAVIIQGEINKHRNELVIQAPFQIVKLLGWTDQYDEDYYYVIYSPGRGLVLSSCVGGFVWLKGNLSGFDYYHMVATWELNTSEQLVEAEIKDRGVILK